MATSNQIGIPNGKSPDGPSANILPFVIATDANGAGFFSTAGGDGSGRYEYNWQTIFVDNSANDTDLQVTCIGSMLSFTVPKNSQCYLPVACPQGSFALRFAGAASQNINAALFDIMLPSIVWGGF